MKYSNIVESYRAMYDSNLDELCKGRHGQSETEYQDSRSERKEDLDYLEIILSHLLDEGYANDIDGAGAIVLSMSEAWMDNILISERVSPADVKLARSGVLSRGADELEKAIKHVTLKRKEEPNKKRRRVTRQTFEVR